MMEPSRPPTQGVGRWLGLSLAALAAMSIVRGIDRIGDGHAASGWLFLGSGIAMGIGLAQASWRSRSARRRPA
jgi:hypothetical protein